MGGRRKKTEKTKMQVLAEELAKDIKTPEDLNQFSAMLTRLTVEAALQGELTHHLGYEPHDAEGRNSATAGTVIPSKQ